MKKTLLATSALALIAATASAVDVELYGQVNKGIFGYNDGQDTNVMIVDNDNSTTRMGLKGAQALDNGLTASVLFEGELSDNNSTSYTQGAAANTGNNQTAVGGGSSASFTSRQARVGVSGNFGGVYLGKQSVATDGVLGTDLAGAQDVLTQDIGSIGGGLKFRNKVGLGYGNGATVNSLVNNSATNTFGDERASSLRYDSPIFSGFQGRASVQQGGDLDLSVFYDGAMGDFKVAGSAGVQYNNDTAQTAATTYVESNQGGSISVAHSSGLAGTVAYHTQTLGNKSSTGDEAEGLYAKVGYAWDAYEVAADYSSNENFGSSTNRYDNLDSIGLAGQYNLGKGVSVAALYRTFDAEVGVSTKTPTESIDLYGVNMRVKF